MAHSSDPMLAYLDKRFQGVEPFPSAQETAEHEQIIGAELTEYWEDALTRPDWYVGLGAYLEQWVWPDVHDDDRFGIARRPFCRLVGKMLDEDRIPLANSGPDFDAKRTELHRQLSGPLLERVIIHHSENGVITDANGVLEPVAERRKLNAIPFARIYAKMFADNPVLAGEPVWSGHFDDNGQQVFFTYNVAVTPDGEPTWILRDPGRRYTLWHAGGAANTRSVAVLLCGDYELSSSSLAQIHGAAATIARRTIPKYRAMHNIYRAIEK